MDVQWMLRIEQRLFAMEQRTEEAEYRKYLEAGKSKKVMEWIEKIKEPVKESKPFLGRSMWRK
jgi:hypothetical protein